MRARVVRSRPGPLEAPKPLAARGLSRRHLTIARADDRLSVTNEGRGPMSVSGAPCVRATLRDGDTVNLDDQLVLLATMRPRAPYLRAATAPPFAFGTPDPHGVVGESPAIWRLREALAFVARRAEHVLVTGPSGVGKELIARAVHDLSARAKKAFVSRNAATLPSGIIDAELFGNAKNYPNAGMPERAGLVGDAHGGTLFLDEIGELSTELSSHLLRLLDGGEYQRLGDSGVRRADLRFVAATNRDPRGLKHDVVARMPLTIAVPGLVERREDIPLLTRHVLVDACKDEPDLKARLFEGREPRVSPRLVEALLAHPFSTHVRELRAILLRSLAESRGTYVDLTPSVMGLLHQDRPTPVMLPSGPTREQVVAALEASGGSVARAATQLGLRNRNVLYRLMEKYGLSLVFTGGCQSSSPRRARSSTIAPAAATSRGPAGNTFQASRRRRRTAPAPPPEPPFRDRSRGP
jgi:two-component system nitrogen regulation response regulator GlnG/two-component system response regulator HydG